MYNENKIHIKITRGMEHHTNLMNIYDKDEFFCDSYRKAAYAITRIVEMSRFEFQKRENRKDSGNDFHYSEYHNNIVAFCADRGQGKTSAMLSMEYALRNMSEEHDSVYSRDEKKAKRDFWTGVYDSVYDSPANPVLSTNFECLPVIDPTCLEKNDSILRTVMSKMFQSASQKWQNSTGRSASLSRDAGREKQRQKEELANQFIKCFKGLDYLYKEEKKQISSYYDDLNMAAEFGDSNNFKTMFIRLVESYLKFMSPDGSSCRNTMMVILIDDADLNTKRAFSIVEEIQKYFVMPGVLILMALHVGTLARTLEQNQLEQYKTLINYSNDPTIKERCHRAMERYIEKLFPSSHRIYLPDISKTIEQAYNSIKLSYFDNNGNDILEKYKYLAKSDWADNYENCLFLLIYAKTGIILTKRGNYLHEFLPSSFRQLNHFLFYLNSMKDVVTQDDKTENGSFDLFQNILQVGEKPDREKVLLWLKNLNIFQDYFLHVWCPERLLSDQLRTIENIHNSPSNIKNFNTVQMIKEIINSNIKDEKSHVADLREQRIADRGYAPLSDVVWALYRLKRSVNPVNYFSFIYAVRMYYSIHTHIVALQGILLMIEKKEPPFKDLFNMLGGRIFPMHWYMKKRLPLFVLGADKMNAGELLQIFPFIYLCNEESQATGITSMALDNNVPKKTARWIVDFRQTPLNNSEYLLFDLLKPVMLLLIRENFNGTKSSSREDKLTAELVREEKTTWETDSLDLVCNLDLQESVYKEFFKKPYTGEYHFLDDMVHAVYGELDETIENSTAIKISCRFVKLLKGITPRIFYILYNYRKKIGRKLNGVNDDFSRNFDDITIPLLMRNIPELPDSNSDTQQTDSRSGSYFQNDRKNGNSVRVTMDAADKSEKNKDEDMDKDDFSDERDNETK